MTEALQIKGRLLYHQESWQGRLSSHDWKHCKSKRDYFTIRSHGRVVCLLMAGCVTNQKGDYFTIRSHGRVVCILMAGCVTTQREITLPTGVMAG